MDKPVFLKKIFPKIYFLGSDLYGDTTHVKLFYRIIIIIIIILFQEWQNARIQALLRILWHLSANRMSSDRSKSDHKVQDNNNQKAGRRARQPAGLAHLQPSDLLRWPKQVRRGTSVLWDQRWEGHSGHNPIGKLRSVHACPLHSASWRQMYLPRWDRLSSWFGFQQTYAPKDTQSFKFGLEFQIFWVFWEFLANFE